VTLGCTLLQTTRFFGWCYCICFLAVLLNKVYGVPVARHSEVSSWNSLPGWATSPIWSSRWMSHRRRRFGSQVVASGGCICSSDHSASWYIMVYGYGSIPINAIFSGMNIHLPAILMFTRGTRFWHTATLDPWSIGVNIPCSRRHCKDQYTEATDTPRHYRRQNIQGWVKTWRSRPNGLFN